MIRTALGMVLLGGIIGALALAGVWDGADVRPQRPPPPATSAPGLPQPGDLTMGGRAGNVMAALSLHPARPGSNTVTVYLAAPATRATTARLQVAGSTIPLQSCGPTCRSAVADVHGGQVLHVVVPDHGTASYSVPPLPAKSGLDLATKAVARMDRLHTYRVDENLSGIRSRYVYETPHRMYVRTWFGDGPQDTLWIGPKVYGRLSPHAPWKLESRGELAPVPYFSWDPFKPLANVHVTGSARMDGQTVTVLSAFGGHGKSPEAIWFTLYVDEATDTVLRSQMWAPDHFMDDRFADFDEPVHLPRPGSG